MRLTVCTSDGNDFEIADFDANSALDLKRALNEDGEQFLTLDMDGATVLINRAHIVSVEVD